MTAEKVSEVTAARVKITPNKRVYIGHEIAENLLRVTIKTNNLNPHSDRYITSLYMKLLKIFVESDNKHL